MADKMKAGTYYIGDLCYVMDDDWDEVCHLMDGSGDREEGIKTLEDGRKFAIFSTAYGDGEYPVIGCGEAKFVGVDSGTIGCICVDDLNLEGGIVTDQINSDGVIITFKEDFNVSSDGETMSFGHVDVETGDQVEDEVEDTCSGCGNTICTCDE